mmetsp:Transcript_2332/g.9332  ORF Transcript_2332/g.9332 Transcript_2332/m.9332 type:complete len:276 (-) Transcript_2332:66-893(-)|eukprot:PRCOL_00002385-RA
MNCHLVIDESAVPNSYAADAGGNNYLIKLLGADTIKQVEPGADAEETLRTLCGDLERRGRRPYPLPPGASTDLGALGCCRIALEVIESHGLNAFAAIVMCCGTGGTHAGLLTGLRAAGDTTPVIGVSCDISPPFQAPYETKADLILAKCHALEDAHFRKFAATTNGPGFASASRPPLVGRDDVIVDEDFVGEGYSIPTEVSSRATELFARHESVLLDPVYTGKAAACFLALARSRKYDNQHRLLFVHTGGTPASYHYQVTAQSVVPATGASSARS